MKRRDWYQERTNLRTGLAALVVFVVGAILMWISRSVYGSKGIFAGLLQDLGTLLIASVCLGLLWELAAKRAFLAELLATSRLADRIEATGVIGIQTQWLPDVDWVKFLAAATHVDVFVAWGVNWRGALGSELTRFARREGTSCRIILPDPSNEIVVSAVASQFQLAPELIQRRVREASEDFAEQFGAKAKGVAGYCEIWHSSRPPLFSFFLFDHVAVVTLYKHNAQNPDVMGFVVQRGGSFYDFLVGERDALIGDGGFAVRHGRVEGRGK